MKTKKEKVKDLAVTGERGNSSRFKLNLGARSFRRRKLAVAKAKLRRLSIIYVRSGTKSSDRRCIIISRYPASFRISLIRILPHPPLFQIFRLKLKTDRALYDDSNLCILKRKLRTIIL